MNKHWLYFCWITLFTLSVSGLAKANVADQSVSAGKQWSWLLYRGFTSDNTLGQILGGRFHYIGEDLYSLELGYRLAEDNFFRRLLGPLVSAIEITGNVSYRVGGGNPQNILELVPYIAFRWEQFPWNNYVYTTVAIGEGVSYVSEVPVIEQRTTGSDGKTGRFINYLMLEVTAALPRYPELSLVFRIHHRSGAFGLYGAGNSGSNVVGLGLRYYFK